MRENKKITRRTYYLSIKKAMPKFKIKFGKTFANEVQSISEENTAKHGYPKIQIAL
ncbi:hypothetical protein [Mesoplasma chauliocola]|uniref:hypothetical protein n=1 Tax=Mesoplasma chauliocola TaxID=216427 RepID=UPI0004BCC689|nr:hypothetical protein [Mesoplasma chauliocola]